MLVSTNKRIIIIFQQKELSNSYFLCNFRSLDLFLAVKKKFFFFSRVKEDIISFLFHFLYPVAIFCDFYIEVCIFSLCDSLFLHVNVENIFFGGLVLLSPSGLDNFRNSLKKLKEKYKRFAQINVYEDFQKFNPSL